MSGVLKLYVGQIPESAHRADVEELFDGYEIVSINWPLSKDRSRKHAPYAFVNLKSKQSTDDAIKRLDGSKMCGRPIRISSSNEGKTKYNLVVDRIPPETAWQDLKDWLKDMRAPSARCNITSEHGVRVGVLHFRNSRDMRDGQRILDGSRLVIRTRSGGRKAEQRVRLYHEKDFWRKQKRRRAESGSRSRDREDGELPRQEQPTSSSKRSRSGSSENAKRDDPDESVGRDSPRSDGEASSPKMSISITPSTTKKTRTIKFKFKNKRVTKDEIGEMRKNQTLSGSSSDKTSTSVNGKLEKLGVWGGSFPIPKNRTTITKTADDVISRVRGSSEELQTGKGVTGRGGNHAGNALVRYKGSDDESSSPKFEGQSTTHELDPDPEHKAMSLSPTSTKRPTVKDQVMELGKGSRSSSHSISRAYGGRNFSPSTSRSQTNSPATRRPSHSSHRGSPLSRRPRSRSSVQCVKKSVPGRIKFFNPKKAFGFITALDPKDYDKDLYFNQRDFVSWSSLQRDMSRREADSSRTFESMPVTFDLLYDPNVRNPKAQGKTHRAGNVEACDKYGRSTARSRSSKRPRRSSTRNSSRRRSSPRRKSPRAAKSKGHDRRRARKRSPEKPSSRRGKQPDSPLRYRILHKRRKSSDSKATRSLSRTKAKARRSRKSGSRSKSKSIQAKRKRAQKKVASKSRSRSVSSSSSGSSLPRSPIANVPRRSPEIKRSVQEAINRRITETKINKRVAEKKRRLSVDTSLPVQAQQQQQQQQVAVTAVPKPVAEVTPEMKTAKPKTPKATPLMQKDERSKTVLGGKNLEEEYAFLQKFLELAKLDPNSRIEVYQMSDGTFDMESLQNDINGAQLRKKVEATHAQALALLARNKTTRKRTVAPPAPRPDKVVFKPPTPESPKIPVSKSQVPRRKRSRPRNTREVGSRRKKRAFSKHSPASRAPAIRPPAIRPPPPSDPRRAPPVIRAPPVSCRKPPPTDPRLRAEEQRLRAKVEASYSRPNSANNSEELTAVWRQKQKDDEAKLQEYEMDDESSDEHSQPPYSDVDEEQAYSGEYGHGPPAKTCTDPAQYSIGGQRRVHDLTS